ncbi:putative flagellar antigen [Trypanosoma cruzi]|nr:putative flagellar antigen [Trypanosoma cruzi]
MFSSRAPAVKAEGTLLQPLRPTRPSTTKPTKPDYFPMSLVRKPMGPAIYPGAAAAEDVSKGLLVSDALHDMTFYTGVSESLPDAGRPVLNSLLFSQRHVVNDSPSVEEEIASINERIRLWRASRLQEVFTNYEHSKQQALLDEKVEERIKERQAAERDRTIRRVSRMLDSLIPELEKAITRTSEAKLDVLNAARHEALLKKWKERDEMQQRFLRDMRIAERRWLVDRQFQRNMDERNSLDSQHYYSFLERKMEERLAFRHLCEAFYNEKIIVGVYDDEREVRKRMIRLEAEDRIDISKKLSKFIPTKEMAVATEDKRTEKDDSITSGPKNTQEPGKNVEKTKDTQAAEQQEDVQELVAPAENVRELVASD